jgi:hypothetical protein
MTYVIKSFPGHQTPQSVSRKYFAVCGIIRGCYFMKRPRCIGLLEWHTDLINTASRMIMAATRIMAISTPQTMYTLSLGASETRRKCVKCVSRPCTHNCVIRALKEKNEQRLLPLKALTLYTCTGEVLGSNLYRSMGYLYLQVFRGFPRSLDKSRDSSLIRPQLLPSKPFAIYQ